MVLIGFGLLFFPLFIVHVAYRIPAISPWFASTWEAGELIAYVAGFEAFLGSLLLGSVTIKQTQLANERATSANELSNQMLANERKRDEFDRQSSVMIINHEMYTGLINNFEYSKAGVFQCYNVPYFKIPEEECILSLTLINTSRTFTIIKVLALESFIRENTPSAFHCLANCVVYQKTSLIDIAPGMECKLHFATTKEEYEKFSSAILTLRMQLMNSIGETRGETISFALVKLHDDILSISSISYSFQSVDGIIRLI